MSKVQYRQQWKVPSDKHNGDTYTVSVTMEGKWKCSCPHWIFRCQKAGVDCKHIGDVKSGGYDQYAMTNYVLQVQNVQQVTLQDDRVTVYVPLIPLGDTHFFVTIVYDCLILGVPWRTIREYYEHLMPRSWTRQQVMDTVKFEGRKIYGEFIEGKGHNGFLYTV